MEQSNNFRLLTEYYSFLLFNTLREAGRRENFRLLTEYYSFLCKEQLKELVK